MKNLLNNTIYLVVIMGIALAVPYMIAANTIGVN